MVQTDFTRDPLGGYEGDYVDMGDPGVMENVAKNAGANIEFGRAVSYTDDNNENVEMIGVTQVELVLDVDVTAQIDYSFKSLDSSGTEVVNAGTEAFDTSHLQTLQNLETTLEALASIDSVTISDANNRTLTIVAASGYILDWTSITSAGVTFTQTNSDNRRLAGLAQRKNKEPILEDGSYISRYSTNDAASVIKKGNVIVQSPTGFDAADTLYFVGYGDDRGRVSNAAGTSGIALPANITFYKSASSADSLGAIALNMP